MEKKFKVTLWSGGKPATVWITPNRPGPSAGGNGYRFTDRDGNSVELSGTVSIEEGHWEYEELGPQI